MGMAKRELSSPIARTASIRRGGDILAFFFVIAAGTGADALEMSPMTTLRGDDRAGMFMLAQALPAGERVLISDVIVTGGKPSKLAIGLPAAALELAGKQDGPVFLMFRDVPVGVTFSAGFPLRDSWAVSLKDMNELTLNAPANVSGRFIMRVALHQGGAVPPQISSFAVTLIPEGASTRAQQPASTVPTTAYAVAPAEPDPRPTIQAPPASKASIGKGEEDAYLERGEALLKSGDFEAARLIFADLADRGSRRAAFRMAQTFDPEVFASLFVVGLSPDLQKARHWYARAVELGAAEAQKRLNQLATSRAQ